MANPAMKIIGKASTEYVDSPATLKGTITKAFGLTLVTIASAIASGVGSLPPAITYLRFFPSSLRLAKSAAA